MYRKLYTHAHTHRTIQHIQTQMPEELVLAFITIYLLHSLEKHQRSSEVTSVLLVTFFILLV